MPCNSIGKKKLTSIIIKRNYPNSRYTCQDFHPNNTQLIICHINIIRLVVFP